MRACGLDIDTPVYSGPYARKAATSLLQTLSSSSPYITHLFKTATSISQLLTANTILHIHVHNMLHIYKISMLPQIHVCSTTLTNKFVGAYPDR